MTPHTWEQEVVNGGHLGDADVWRCQVCGCCGGPVHPWMKSEEGPTWEPFIPGPAKNVSGDCLKAQEEIKWYLDERLQHLASLGPKGVSPRYAQYIREAITEAVTRVPPVTNLIKLVPLFYEIERFRGRPHLEEVCDRLLAMGFRLT